MQEAVNRITSMIKPLKGYELTAFFGFCLSWGIVALGQPARLGWIGALAAVCGFALFFCSIPANITKKKRFAFSLLWFALVQMVQLSWMTSIEFQGYYVLIVYCLICLGLACQFGLLTVLVPAEGKIPWSKLIFCVAIWTLMEWTRLFFLCGFSWNPIGLALTHFTSSLQFTSLFGVFGMSFWVMLTNLCGINAWRSRFKLYPTVNWAVLASIPYLFGIIHLLNHLSQSQKEQSKLNIALIQTALLPTEKIPHPDRMDDFISPIVQWQRIIKSLKDAKEKRWDLIVLPEAAVPLLSDLSFYQYETIRALFIAEFGHDVILNFPPLIYPYAEERFILERKIWCVSNLFLCQTLANYYRSEFVIGLDHSDKNERKNFNSAFYLKPNSISHDRYDKQVLLPLAEYLPLDSLRPLARWYGIFDFFSQGEGSKVFGQKVPFSVAICYEETFPEIMRAGRENGAKLFINISNDNYYPDSTLHEQHFYHARLRAVENGIPLIRSCNSGVTAAVDSLGMILKRFDESNPSQEGILNYPLPTYQYSTLFSFWGEAGVVSICLMVVFVYLRMRFLFRDVL
jgi:apolipoprotein N-acyltransferase